MNEFVLPELKQIIGAMLFVRKEPLTAAEIRRVLSSTAERRGGVTADFAKANEKQVREAVAELERELAERKLGFHLIEVAGGWRLENDANCGPWLRVMLQKGRGTRLSLPALETLAIIAYRQPCVRSEIEAVRGVAVDAILRNLLEMQLIRVIGRSELPGRPWMFGTTQKFMEHFGLKSLDDLPGTDELRRLEAEQTARAKKADGKKASEEKTDGQMKLSPIEEAAAAGKDVEEEEAAEEDLFEREGLSEEEIVGGEEDGGDSTADGDEDEFDDEDEEDEFDEDDDEFDDEDEDDDEWDEDEDEEDEK
jgi:segregation and condensation protein B